MQLKISILLFISIIFSSCSLEINKKTVDTLFEKKEEVIKEKPKKVIKKKTETINNITTTKKIQKNIFLT